MDFAYYDLVKTRWTLKMRSAMTTNVTNEQDYLARLQAAIEHLHNCGAAWRESVPTHGMSRRQTIWRGGFDVFDLTGHPKPTAPTVGRIRRVQAALVSGLRLYWKFHKLLNRLKQPWPTERQNEN